MRSIHKKLFQTIPGLVLITGSLVLSSIPQVTSAAVVMASGFGENDCSGYFTTGNGFDSCQIFAADNLGVDIQISPVIIKFDEALGLGSDSEINNTSFPTVDGSEWSFSNLGTDNSSGDWLYNPDANDPGVRYWAAKAGGKKAGFNLFWEVDDADLIANGGVCDPSGGQAAFTLDCLNAANIVTGGSWTTPDGKQLSHITFYDSDPAVIPDPPTPDPNSVPIPAAVWLFGTGLFGMMGFTRRKSNATLKA